VLRFYDASPPAKYTVVIGMSWLSLVSLDLILPQDASQDASDELYKSMSWGDLVACIEVAASVV